MGRYYGDGRSIRLKLATNLVLGVLLSSIGALCFAPMDNQVAVEMENGGIYRSAG